ncbi:hypothetical protein V6N13_014518 [Hibiscus sabdariffa]|uniref:Xylanase inhibitor C-terminal domain-containing protein n=2 Tax=Hibiscus sabdariffa TaxID=183260 RepID=A0ABR2RVW0_9ROSI
MRRRRHEGTLSHSPSNTGRTIRGLFQLKSINKRSSVVWRIFGSNSVVKAAPGVLCLTFVDGGLNTRASIVIGDYQMENHLLQFDLSQLFHAVFQDFLQ